MRSGKSCFDSGVFRKSVKRFWPVWALYAFVWFIALPLGILNNSHQLPEPGSVSYYAVDAVNTTGIWLCPLAACAAAMAVFSHLYNERSANFYAALPVRRGAMFASCAAAGLLPLLAVNVIIFLLSLLLASVGGFADPPALWQYLAGSTLLVTAFFGIAAFCALLTGNAVMMPLLFAAVNVAAWALGEIAVMVPMNFSLGFRYGSVGHWADIFSPLVSLLGRLHYDYSYPAGPSGEPVCGIGGWNWLIIYAATGIVLLLIALAFYLRRDMETAGDVVAVPPLRPVFKAAAAVLAAFLVGNLIYDLGFAEADDLGHAVIYSLCMAAGAFLGWFAAEMLLEKSFAVFRAARLHRLGRGQRPVRGLRPRLRARRDGLRAPRAGFRGRRPRGAEHRGRVPHVLESRGHGPRHGAARRLRGEPRGQRARRDRYEFLPRLRAARRERPQTPVRSRLQRHGLHRGARRLPEPARNNLKAQWRRRLPEPGRGVLGQRGLAQRARGRRGRDAQPERRRGRGALQRMHPPGYARREYRPRALCRTRPGSGRPG